MVGVSWVVSSRTLSPCVFDPPTSGYAWWVPGKGHPGRWAEPGVGFRDPQGRQHLTLAAASCRRVATAWQLRKSTWTFCFFKTLCIPNTSEAIYFSSSSRSFFCLDLSISSPAIFTFFSWGVLDCPHGNYPFPVQVVPTQPLPRLLSHPPHWKLEAANWSLFETSVLLPSTLPVTVSITKWMILSQQLFIFIICALPI